MLTERIGGIILNLVKLIDAGNIHCNIVHKSTIHLLGPSSSSLICIITQQMNVPGQIHLHVAPTDVQQAI